MKKETHTHEHKKGATTKRTRTHAAIDAEHDEIKVVQVRAQFPDGGLAQEKHGDVKRERGCEVQGFDHDGLKQQQRRNMNNEERQPQHAPMK